jgi:glycogen debranching enzyme
MALETLARLRVRSDTLRVSRGRSVLVTDLDGFIDPAQKQGLFVHQTRMLSRYRCYLNGAQLRPIALSNIEQHRSLAYYVQLPPEMNPGNLSGSGNVPDMAEHSIELLIHRTVGAGMREDLMLTNFNQKTTKLRFEIEVDADFADQEEAGKQRKQFGEMLRFWKRGADGRWALSFDYRAHHHYEKQGNKGEARAHRGIVIRFERCDSEPKLDGMKVCFELELEAHGSWEASIDYVPLIDAKELPQQYQHRLIPGTRDQFDQLAEKFEATSANVEVPSSKTLSATVGAAVRRAREDLGALRLYDLDYAENAWVPAAGIPLYVALFGRDTLNAAWQAALITSDVMRGTLAELARWRGTELNKWRDEQPNRMLHEAHTGLLATLNYNPRVRYYGSLTTPSFYCIGLAELWRWSNDHELQLKLIDTALKSLEWLDHYALSHKDGFYQYQTMSEQGVKNQGWKDSSDAIVYGDGSQVPDPIAIVEGQGYVFAAKRQLAQLLWTLGRQDEARRLHGQARELGERFENSFWMEDQGFYAMGLDGDGRRIDSISSNPGHCLTTGIVSAERGARIAERIMRSDMFSGWGIRTLSTEHPSYNPYSYHRGSVWPVEQAAIAAGMWRYHQYEYLLRLCKSQFELAEHFESFRLPEVFSGHPRDDRHPFPALYPEANWPQAWSASAVIMMLGAMLGTFPWAPYKLLLLDPHLPEWLPQIDLINLRVGQAVVSLRFRRQPDGNTDFEILDQMGELRVVRHSRPWTTLERFGEELRDELLSIR